MEIFTTKILELDKNNCYMPIPEEIVMELGIKAGDDYELNFNKETGSIEVRFLKFKSSLATR